MNPHDEDHVTRTSANDTTVGDAAAEEEVAEGGTTDRDAALELENLRRERDELQNRLLRTVADYQNLGRRAEQNVASARDQQAMDMARALVDVLDNFDRALAVDPEKVSAKDVLTGVSMVHGAMMGVLSRFGIERVEVQPGDAFDPMRHEALMRQKAEGVEPGHVTQQFQPGYALRDKTIRPAKVAVAE